MNIEHSWLDSRGPGRERSMLTDLLKSEEFCLQLDSHSDTVQVSIFSCLIL